MQSSLVSRSCRLKPVYSKRLLRSSTSNKVLIVAASTSFEATEGHVSAVSSGRNQRLSGCQPGSLASGQISQMTASPNPASRDQLPETTAEPDALKVARLNNVLPRSCHTIILYSSAGRIEIHAGAPRAACRRRLSSCAIISVARRKSATCKRCTYVDQHMP